MKKWVVAKKQSGDIINQLLMNRKIEDKKQFLNPDYYQDVLDCFLFEDMNKAVSRIKKAISNNEKIGIFADYDADGIPGAALLTNLFAKLGAKTEVYIPLREEGYGLNQKGLKTLSNLNCKVIITVDLGITNKEEVEYAKLLGMDVIVTDHHEIQKEKIPTGALAIIHPLLSKKYPNKNLSGGAVAWKLGSAIISKLVENQKKAEFLTKWSLDLATITLICDLVPLVGENRTLVKYGFLVLKKTQNIGLQELYKQCAINIENIGTYTVGFQIGPRINAPGRIGDQNSGKNHPLSFDLLTSDNKKEIKEIVRILNDINIARQEELSNVLQQAEEIIKKDKLDNKKIILVYGKDWPKGVIGLVAGRLVEKYCRPAIVFTQGKEVSHGSARSIEGFHILEALEKSEKLLLTHGGHAQAAGLSLENKHLENLYDLLVEMADKKIKNEDMIRKIKIDAQIDFDIIDFDFWGQLKKFEPFGIGNPRPIFLTKNVKICSLRTVGKEQNHLKLILENSSQKIDAIGFDMGKFAKNLSQNDCIDIVYTVDENNYNGKNNLQLSLLDFEKK